MKYEITGKAGEFIDRGDNTYGGKHVINPSGGLISKGHPLGATGKFKLQVENFKQKCCTKFTQLH